MTSLPPYLGLGVVDAHRVGADGDLLDGAVPKVFREPLYVQRRRSHDQL